MKRLSVSLVSFVTFALGACDTGPDVFVEAAVQPPGAEAMRTLADLPVELLPFDRDALFDSLTQAADSPEPQVPPELREQQLAIRDAQEESESTRERWQIVRDSLRLLGDELQQRERQGQRATPQYQQLFRRFEALDQQVAGLQRESDESFQRFTDLQQAAQSQADSVRAAQDAWAERAFRDYDEIVAARLEALDREAQVDTTDAAGIARFSAPNGQWWVYARYELPLEELYWNIPVDVTGDSVGVRLTQETASVRPIF